jgi:hypothetical protein
VAAVTDAARIAIVEYISWFNDSRLHESLGDRSPARDRRTLRCENRDNRTHIMRARTY